MELEQADLDIALIVNWMVAISIMIVVYSQWPMQEETQEDLNSSFVIVVKTPNISTVNILVLGKFTKDSMLSIR